MPVTKDNVTDVFTYHSPTEDQLPKYKMIRSKAHELAVVILENTPPCADQQAALRLLREAVYTANGAVALRGQV